MGIRPSDFQRGIDVDAYTYPKLDFSAVAAARVAYVKQLNANSISISFPVFMSNARSSTVFATAKTPTPAQLGLFIADAEHAGLYVSIRPLLSEFQIGGNQTRWVPSDMSGRFASYQQLLLPYARMAQARKVGMFIVGAEFQQFGNSPLWDSLDQALAGDGSALELGIGTGRIALPLRRSRAVPVSAPRSATSPPPGSVACSGSPTSSSTRSCA